MFNHKYVRKKLESKEMSSSSVIKLSKEEVIQIADELNPVKTSTWKWGSCESYVFERAGSHYMFRINVHGQEGWQIDEPTTAQKVKPVSKTITEWVLDSE